MSDTLDKQALDDLARGIAATFYQGDDRQKSAEAVAEGIKTSGYVLNPEQVHRVCAAVNRELLSMEKQSHKTDLWRTRFTTAKPDQVLSMLGIQKTSSPFDLAPVYRTPTLLQLEGQARQEANFRKKSSVGVTATSVEEGLRDLQKMEQGVADAIKEGEEAAQAARDALREACDDLTLEMAKTAGAGFSSGEVIYLVDTVFAREHAPPGAADAALGGYTAASTAMETFAKASAAEAPPGWEAAQRDLSVRDEVANALRAGLLKESHPLVKAATVAARKAVDLSLCEEALRHLQSDAQYMRAELAKEGA